MAEEHRAIGALRAQLRGMARVPGDSGYDDTCRPWNLAIAQHPPVVVLAADSSRDVRLDPSSRRLHIEAGVLWHDVLPETRRFGLASLSGFAPYVGAVGYTLGGGLGWLARQYGLAADGLLAVELVTADGRLFTVDTTQHSDLFAAQVRHYMARRGEAPADDPPAR